MRRLYPKSKKVGGSIHGSRPWNCSSSACGSGSSGGSGRVSWTTLFVVRGERD